MSGIEKGSSVRLASDNYRMEFTRTIEVDGSKITRTAAISIPVDSMGNPVDGADSAFRMLKTHILDDAISSALPIDNA